MVFFFAGSASASQLTIFWDDNSSNESGFKIERSVNGGAFSPLATTAANTTSYVDTSVVAGASYGYRVQAFNTVTVSGFSNTASSTVPVAAKAPVIATQPSSHTITAGTSVSLSVVATGTPAPTYQWRKGSTSLSGQTSNTLKLSSVSVADQASYVCIVSNSAGSVTSSSAVITVTPATSRPAFTVQPTNGSALLGASVSFKISATGTPTPTLKWYKDGALISGATGSTYSISNLTAAHAGSYSVVATNSAGSTTSALATLTVSGVKPVITLQPVARTAAAGQAVSFVAAASGTPAPALQWLKNNVVIAGATTATLTIKNVSAADVASYSVVATNSAGSTSSSDAKLTLSEIGKITQVIAKAVSSGWGNAALQMTFDVNGGTKSVLFRAIGPGLAQFTKASPLVDPTLTLTGGTISQTNDNWGGTAVLKDNFARVGAFPLTNNSKDAAILAPLPARRYSAVLGGKATGMALAELYDADVSGSSTSHLSAVTVRGLVGKGDDALTVGFHISGNTPVRLLVRAVGPSLPHLQNLVKDPRLDLYKDNTLVRSNDNWGGSSTLVNLFKQVGAASLAAASKDSAMEITVSPGVYSAVITGVNGSIGLARLEIWVLP
jgi:hypothetical protein